MSAIKLITAAAILISMHTSAVDAAQASNSFKNFQMKTMYEPASYVLKREARGAVTISVGFTSQEVDQAMDEHYDRIENMMFTRMVISDDAGGSFIADDGCD